MLISTQETFLIITIMLNTHTHTHTHTHAHARTHARTQAHTHARLLVLWELSPYNVVFFYSTNCIFYCPIVKICEMQDW